MQIVKRKVGDLVMYENNTKIHTDEQIDEIIKSIELYGMNDPIGIWHNTIVEGHGRYLALKKMDYQDEFDCVLLDHLTDEQRREYTIIHNKLTTDTGYDFDILEKELNELTELKNNFDLSNLTNFIQKVEKEAIEDRKEIYTQKIEAPIYEPVLSVQPKISKCYNKEKYQKLLKEIEKVDCDKELSDFLKLAATRFIEFDFTNIAEYYAHSNKEVQDIFEKLALVIIDFNKAIEYGFIKLSEEIEEITRKEVSDER